MSKLSNFIQSEEKSDFSSVLSVSAHQGTDSQFFSLTTGNEHLEIESLGWGESRRSIGILQDDGKTPPVVNLHLDSKETIAAQQLQTLLKALNSANYFADNKKMILLGDLNINLSSDHEREKLADILDQNNLAIEASAVESPIERERSIEIALNQQQHKGGLKKTDVKNIIFVLRRRQLEDIPSIEKLYSTYKSLQSPQKMRDDGFDHNPVALTHDNILYVSIANLPTQPGGKVSVNDVIMTAEGRDADLKLREKIKETMESVFKIEIKDLAEYVPILHHELELRRRQSASDLEFTLFLVNKMDEFIKTVIDSVEFSDYAKMRVTKAFSDKFLDRKQFENFARLKSEYTLLDDVFSDLNPKHKVTKAIEEIVKDNKPHNMKVERLLSNFLEMISPQPNNGYEPALLSPNEMETLRINIICDLIKQHPEVGQVQIHCNDTKESDYHSFRVKLAEMLNEYLKSIVNDAESQPLLEVSPLIQIENENQIQRRGSFVSDFFKRIGNACCGSPEDIEPKQIRHFQK